MVAASISCQKEGSACAT